MEDPFFCCSLSKGFLLPPWNCLWLTLVFVLEIHLKFAVHFVPSQFHVSADLILLSTTFVLQKKEGTACVRFSYRECISLFRWCTWRYTQLKSVSTRILQNKLLIAYSSSSNTKYTAPIKSIQLLWCFVLLIPFKNQLRSTKFGFLTKVVSVVMVTWWPVIVLDSSWLVTLSEMMAWAKQISTRAKSLPWQWI